MPAPSFAVYGLDPTFAGPRSVAGWQRLMGDAGPTWYVSLLHGEVPGAHLIVTTVGKIPAQSDGPEGHLVGPTGVQDAFRLAVAEMVTVERRRRSASLREEMLKIPDSESLASSSTWSRRVAVVDHRLVRFAFRSPSGGAWAAVADLGPVALALSGDAIALDEYELVAQDSPTAR